MKLHRSTSLRKKNPKGNNNRSAYLRRTLKNEAQTLIALLLATLILSSCAIPSSPTGGPPDKEPPRLISAQPVNGTTNFTEQTLEFTFNEYINRQTLQRALSIEPDLNIPYDISWKRTTATVKFEDQLPENTTVIITLGTDLTDIRSNKLKEPIQLALSTGPTIAKGEIRVRVANYEDGLTQEGRTVFLFRLEEENTPFDPTSPPLYVSQTDTAGIAKFIALADGLYRPMWIEDRNRSRTWQPDREPAQPFDTPAIEIRNGSTLNAQEEPDTAYTPQVWIYQPDTTAPTLLAVGVTSERRLRLRFSEPVEFDPGIRLNLHLKSDSTASQTPFTQAIPLYVLPEDSTIIVAQTLNPLPADSTFWLAQESNNQTTFITDLAGNPWQTKQTQTEPQTTSQTFTGSSTPDQTELEIITTSLAQNPNPLITDSVTITYNSLIESNIAGPSLVEPYLSDQQIAVLTQQIIDSTQLIWDNQLVPLQQLAAEGKIRTAIRENRLIFATPPTTNWPTTPSPTIQLYDPITKSRNPITPNFTDPEQFGDLEVFVSNELALYIQSLSQNNFESRLVIQLLRDNFQPIWSQTIYLEEPILKSHQNGSRSSLKTSSIRQGTYFVKYFIDVNSDGKWNSGEIRSKLSIPEYLNILTDIKIVNGFTGEITLVL